MATDAARVDVWLWSVRIYKTRAQANEACRKGRVRVNGESAKPATRVRVGDRVEARRRERLFVVDVHEVIDKRVSAARAAECLVDHSPEPTRLPAVPAPGLPGARDRGSGRPTKRDRRRLEEWRKTARRSDPE